MRHVRFRSRSWDTFSGSDDITHGNSVVVLSEHSIVDTDGKTMHANAPGAAYIAWPPLVDVESAAVRLKRGCDRLDTRAAWRHSFACTRGIGVVRTAEGRHRRR